MAAVQKKQEAERREVAAVQALVDFAGLQTFSVEEVRAATRGFHDSTKVGAGGFGSVFRATLRGKHFAH